MTIIKEALSKTIQHQRNEVRLSREMEVAGKDRKKKAALWVKHADKLMDEKKAKKHNVSIRACDAVLRAINKCSFTGDFTNAKQQRIADIARYSLRTTGNAIRALMGMGLVFTKHQYKGEGKERRRVASFTIIAAFRKKFDSIKNLLNEGLPVKLIEQKLLAFSVCATTASQLKALNKVKSKFQIFDTSEGEIKSFDEGVFDMHREYSADLAGVL